MSRMLPDHSYKAIKAAIRRLNKQAGGVESATFVTRVKKTHLADYGNINCPDKFMPADIIADLEADTGQPIITRELAKITGHVLLPVEVNLSKSEWAIRLAKIGKEASDVFAKASDALADDGDIDATEAVSIIKELDEAITAFADMRSAVHAKLEDKQE